MQPYIMNYDIYAAVLKWKEIIKVEGKHQTYFYTHESIHWQSTLQMDWWKPEPLK